MIENTILAGLITNEVFMRKTIPFLKDEYFTDPTDKLLFDTINKYVEKYNGLPNKEALAVAIDSRDDLNEDAFKSAMQGLDNLSFELAADKVEWLTDETEKFCQNKAVINAVRESILILDDKNSNLDKGSIPQLLSDALAVGFDTNIGHDFLDNADERFDFYHAIESKVPFDLEYMNKITKGGVSRKALIVYLAGTGVGKTLVMCHSAAANLMDGKNVLYITAEMAEERIAERIDANLLDVTVDQLKTLDREHYHIRMSNIHKRTTGKLIIKEYPTATANVNHFRFLFNELKLKKGFVPDIVYVDYLNICASSRMKQGANVNSYTYIKAIAEELRGLAVEFNIPIVTATQTTRSGFNNSDVGLEDTSESFGLPATADFMCALISSEELEALGQLMIKQLKNRWGDINSPKRFVVGIDRSKMRLYDVEQSAQEDIADRGSDSVMDSTEFGQRYEEDFKPKSKFHKPRFEGFG